MRDAEVAYAIHPIVRKYLLSVKDTSKALTACGVPRAANVAQIASALKWPAGTLTQRNSLAGGDSAATVDAAVPVDHSLSENN
jgi:hypothetical protein